MTGLITKIFILCVLIPVISFHSYSQNSDLIIHSFDNLKFRVYLNDIVQGEKYDTLTKINNLESKSIKIKIKFENKNCSGINQLLYFKPGMIYIYNIKPQKALNKLSFPRNKFILKQVSCDTKADSSSENYFEDEDANSIVITTTNTSGSYVTHYILPNYSGDIGCPWPLTIVEFNKRYFQIPVDSTEFIKLNTAKELFASSCIFTDEVKKIGLLIKDETLRFDFVKFAFKCTFDIGNYFMLQDIFQSEIIKNEFSIFLKNPE